MDSALVPSTSSTKSSFWSTKDGKFGTIITIVLAAAGLYGLYHILPFLVQMAQNLVSLVLLGLALFVLMYMIFDNDIRTFVFYLYKSLIRALRSLLINTDPVGIIKTYIQHLRKQFEQLEEKIRELSGARKKLDDAIERDKADLDEQLRLADVATRKGLTGPEIAVYTNQAGRLTERIKKYNSLLSKLTTLYNLLNDIRKACKVIIADKENQVKSIETERETMNIGFSAFKSAVSILKGDPDKKYFYDEAMEAIQNDISMKSGIIEQYVNESSEIIKSIDLQNASFEEKGSKLLERWQTQGLNALLSQGNSTTIPVAAQYEMVPAATDNKYSQLITK